MREFEISAQRHRNYSLFTFQSSLFTAAPGPPRPRLGGAHAAAGEKKSRNHPNAGRAGHAEGERGSGK